MPKAVLQAIPDPGYTDQPKTFVTESAMRSHGWLRVRAGWFIQADHAITAQQRAAARDLAARSGLTFEARNDKRGLYVTRLVATAAGMLLAFGILAMTIGLIRGEASRDLQTLTATGATGAARRTLTAATAAALALLGSLLGLLGAYIGLLGGYQDKLKPLVPVPIGYLAVIVVGLPIVAGGVAWLVGGREPEVLARRALE
jgi:putative ABC transport system permease protein